MDSTIIAAIIGAAIITVRCEKHKKENRNIKIKQSATGNNNTQIGIQIMNKNGDDKND